MSSQQEEMEVIEILRDRCREYRELLSVAASIMISIENSNDHDEKPALKIFLDRCQKHGLFSSKEIEDVQRD